jgi:pyruvate formate lyase activating enzyme
MRVSAVLDQMTREGFLSEALPDRSVRCLACGHRCLIREGKRGVCQVRFNDQGKLKAPWGYVAALQDDPIEKKPFFHVLPGARALTFGMLGCDFHCGYCQNWITSQTLRDPGSDMSIGYVRRISPDQMIDHARAAGADLIVSSYNEPLITTEWAIDIFAKAKEAGMRCAYVSNGNATVEALEVLRPYLSAYKIDLKSMSDKNYRSLGGVLNNTLDTIRKAHEMKLWVEVVTLTVPGFNDSNEELWDAAKFIRGVSADIPWHVTAFHPDYKMHDREYTPPQTLIRAAEIGREAGLNFVYAGNLPGQVGEYEDTICPTCGTHVIKRRAYVIKEYAINAQGGCPTCGKHIPGLWHGDRESVSVNGNGFPNLL